MEARTVVITGASAGIGNSIAELFVKQGFGVFASVRKQTDASRLQKQFGTERFTPLLFDITDEKAVHQAADQVRSALQGKRLTALINNAGVTQIEPAAVCSIQTSRQVLDTNLMGYLICAQAFLPLLGTDPSLTGPPGKVIQLSSVLGEAEFPFQAVYCAAKHGLEALTSCMRRELAPYGIKFVCIRPGVTASDLWGKIDWTPYDNTPWQQGMRAARNLLHALLKRPCTTGDVAQTVYTAVMASRPRIVYYVGSWDQWLSIKLIGGWTPLWFKHFMWNTALRNSDFLLKYMP